MQSRIEDLREFIINNFLFGDGTALDYDTPFLKNGIIDWFNTLRKITISPLRIRS